MQNIRENLNVGSYNERQLKRQIFNSLHSTFKRLFFEEEILAQALDTRLFAILYKLDVTITGKALSEFWCFPLA